MPFGAAPEVTENCWSYTIEHEDEVEVNTCGSGEVRRTFTVTDDYGNVSTKIQTFTVVPDQRPVLPGILNVVADCPVSYDALRPEDIVDAGNAIEWFQLLPDGSRGGRVSPNAFADYGSRIAALNADYCGQLAVSFEDELFDVCLPSGFNIRRTWKVLDHCDPDFEQVLIQLIKVEDTVPPVIVDFPGDVTTSVAHNTCFARLRAGFLGATDNCDTAPTYTSEFSMRMRSLYQIQLRCLRNIHGQIHREGWLWETQLQLRLLLRYMMKFHRLQSAIKM